MPRVYLSPPHLSGREAELVADAIESNWIAPLGPHVDAFEAELAAVAGVEHAVALSSGTAALHLALVVLGILLALLCRLLVAATARRRARTADRRLRSAIGTVAEELVVKPVRAELAAYDTVRDGLDRALR